MRRKILYFVSTIIAVVVVSLSACDTNRENRAVLNNKKLETKNNAVHIVKWLKDDKSVLIDKTWLYTIEEKRFVNINFSLTKVGLLTENISLETYPESDKIFFFDHNNKIAFTIIGQALSESIEIPPWLNGNSQADNIELTNIPFWLDKNQIFVQQFESQSPNNYACGIYLINQNTWQILPKNTCLESSFYNLTYATSVKNDFVVTLSSAEGKQALDLFKLSFDNSNNFQQNMLNSLVISAPVPAQIQIADNNKVKLVFPCVIEDTKEVSCLPNSEKFWSVYEWLPGTNELRVRFPKLPHNIFAASSKDTFAWFEQDNFCVGSPDNQKSCLALPTEN